MRVAGYCLVVPDGIDTGLARTGLGLVGNGMMGTRSNGLFGCEVFTVNSKGSPGFCLNSGENTRFTLNNLPGWTSLISTFTPSAFTTASESFRSLLLLLRTVSNW